MSLRLPATDPKETSGTDGKPVNDQAAVVAAPVGTPEMGLIPEGQKDDVNAAESATGELNVAFTAELNAHHERCEHLRRFSENRLSSEDQFVQTAIDNSIDLLLDQVTQQIQDYARTVCTPAIEKNGADPKFVAMLLTKALGENLDPLKISAPTIETAAGPAGTRPSLPSTR